MAPTFTKFSGLLGDIKGQPPCKILGNSDKGILRGQVGEKVFDPISPPLGEMGH